MFEVGVIDAALNRPERGGRRRRSLGLGTVYIGGMRPASPGRRRRTGPAAAGDRRVFGLCVGTPDPEAPASVKPRPPVRGAAPGRYSLPAQDDGLAQYDGAMSAFLRQPG